MHERRMNVKSTERQFHHSSAFENHQMWCLHQLKNSKTYFTFSFCSSSDLLCCERCSETFHSNYNFSKRAVKARHGGALCNCAGKNGEMATKNEWFPLFDARVPLFNPVLDPRESLGFLLWFILECLIGWPTNQRFHYGILQAINKLSREKCCDSVVNPIT